MPLLLAAEGPNALLTEHQVLIFFIQLALLVGVARIMGGLMKLAGQPAVVGELLAGIALGPSLFGSLAPGVWTEVFGDDIVQAGVFGLSWLGVIFLLIVIGFETDLGIMSRFKTAALAVSAGGLVTPLVAVYFLAQHAPGSFRGAGVEPLVFGGFMALSLSVAALPVVAKILQDLNFLRRNFGQITLAAGMTMDAIGWLLLAALAGIAQDGFDPVALGTSFGGLVIFVVVVATIGRRFLDWIMRLVLDRGSSITAAMTITVVAALAGGIVTQWLRLEAILGAFLVGIVLATLRHQMEGVGHTIEVVTSSFFAPIFFAFSGLRVDIGLLGSIEAAGWAAALIGAALAAKIIGTLLFGRLGGILWREGLALGAGLSALGAMGIVVAIVGINLGVVSETGYTVMVVAAITTSLLAPQLLKLAVRGWEIPPEEKARLDREELVAQAEILSSRRVLLPTRGGRNSRFAASLMLQILDDVEITVLAIDIETSRWRRLIRRSMEERPQPDDVLEVLEGSGHRLVRRVAADASAAIADEARLGYDLVVLGASEDEREGIGGLFSNVVDGVLARVEVPVVVVRTPKDHDLEGGDSGPDRPPAVLVPVVATRASRAAEELAYSIARELEGSATALHVIVRQDGQGLALDEHQTEDAQVVGKDLLGTSLELASRLGIEVTTDIEQAAHPEATIVDRAASGFDLLVIGASNRLMSDRAYLGHRARYIIENSLVPVVVVAIPATYRQPVGVSADSG